MKLLLRGLPRSGTHLVKEWLLDKHFPDIEVDDSRRHRLVDFAQFGDETRIICISKHPMAWLTSIHQWVIQNARGGAVAVDGVRYEANTNLEYFILLNPVLFRLWLVSMTNWISVKQNVIHLDHKKLIENPTASVDHVASLLGVDPPTRVEGLPRDALYHGIPFDFDYYLNDKWRLLYDRVTWEYCRGMFSRGGFTVTKTYLDWKDPE